MRFQQKVYRVVSRIPRGTVLTYKQVARRAGNKRAARAVGNILNKNPFPKSAVPCHRVVRSDGTIGGYAHGKAEKRALLQKEGVIIKNGRVSL